MNILKKSSDLKNVAKLVSGTTVAQAIPILISPILSRLYNETEFGLYSTFYSYFVVLSVIISGRLELAIFVPKELHKIKEVLTVQFYFALISFVVVFMSGMLVIGNFDLSVSLPYLNTQFWLLACLSAFFGVIAIGFSNFVNRLSEFGVLAKSKLVRSSIKNSGTLAFGWLKMTRLGLIFSEVIANALISIYLGIVGVSKHFKLREFRISKNILYTTLRRYKNFLRFSIPSGILENLSAYMPALLLPVYFGFNALGLFAFAQRIINLPSTLISQAFGEVFKQKFSTAYSDGQPCLPIFHSTLKRLLIIAIPGYGLLYLIAPDFFSIVFGDNWQYSGVITRFMIPMIIMQFVVSPLSSILLITERQKVDFAFQIILFPLIFLSIYLGKIYDDFALALKLYSGVYATKYIVEFIIAYTIIRKYERQRV